MTALKPALVQALGNDGWAWVPAIAVKDAPTATEINDAAAFNLSCSVFGDQAEPTRTTERVTLPRLACETDTFERPGATSYTAPELRVSFGPQSAEGADGRKAWDAMDDRSQGFLVRRQGVASATDFATGDRVDVIPAQLGEKIPVKTSTGNDAVYAFDVDVFITGKPAWNVSVMAA